MMNSTKLSSFLMIAFLFFNTLNAQKNRQIADGDRTGQWFLGVGLNLVNDDFTGSVEGSSVNFSNPYIFDAEYALNNAFGFYGSLSFNKYIAGKVVDSRIVQEGDEANYMAFDVGSNYYFRKQLDNFTFEPYLTGGFGYTNIGSYKALPNGSLNVMEIPSVGRITLNAGLGANYWFSTAWGVNVNVMAKYGIDSNEYENDYVSGQVQFSFGAVYSVGKN